MSPTNRNNLFLRLHKPIPQLFTLKAVVRSPQQIFLAFAQVSIVESRTHFEVEEALKLCRSKFFSSR